MLKIWNTASRKIETVKPIKAKQIGFYACGPTVYQRAHIGNFRSYILEDILRRQLEHDGLKVRHVMNITDVGHLVGDTDHGEDKMEKAAATTSKSAWEIAKEFTALFKQDMKRLNIKAPQLMPKATDNIKAQINLIKQLERKGFTYQTADGIYFNTAKFKPYGKFSGQPLAQKQAGARVEVGAKKHATDFALWKFSYPNGLSRRDYLSSDAGRRTQDAPMRQMEWKSPWGVGFPGWHIECSAMSRQELGQPFDLHAGGVDHIAVHHENEIAQSQAAYGKKLANYWFHVEFLMVEGQKMSKSLGNIFTLEDFEKRGFDALDFRYFLLSAHYRQKQNFTWEALESARNTLGKLRQTVQAWDKPKGDCADLSAEFFAAMDNDLNTPQALAVLWKLVDSNCPSGAKAAVILKMDKVLGLDLEKYVAKPAKIPKEIQKLLDQRAQARQNKDWKKSDKLRDELSKKGWVVEDTKEGQKVIAKG